MFGCDSAAVICASVRKRCCETGSLTWARCRSFTATGRLSSMSVARHTSPMPPTPMRSSRRYRSTSTTPAREPSPRSGVSLTVDHCFHDRFGYRSRQSATAGVTALDDDRHRDLGVVSGSEGDEPVVGVAVADLSGTGFPRYLDTGDRRGFATAFVSFSDQDHGLGELFGSVGADCFA